MRKLFGRKILYTNFTDITAGNLKDCLQEVVPIFLQNQSDIIYLQNYRRGKQPIYDRKKTIRDDIKNIVVKNMANEIVNFKTGYLLGEPIQYTLRAEATDKTIQTALNEFNDECYLEKKFNLDKELADYMYTCGTAYRMVLPNKDYKKGNKNSSPFHIYTLDPAFSGVVYSTELGHKPVLSFTTVGRKGINGQNELVFYCYTDKYYFEIVRGADGKFGVPSKTAKNPLGRIPMIEYPLNLQRMSAFEPVITILDGINAIESNRVDAIEQVVQALMVFYNVDIDLQGVQDLQKYGAICLTAKDNSGAKQDVKYLSCDLDQTQTQTLVDSLEQDVLTLCGMPNRNGGTSTSDTGTAVIMRDGWSDAEARAKEDELTFKDSEMEFLKLALYIEATLTEVEQPLSITNIDIRFTRRNYENIAQKTTVLTQMLGSDKIDPQLAFTYCGIFDDPQLAYQQSKEYYDKVTAQTEVNDIVNEQ